MSVHREKGLFTQSDYYCEQSIRINTVVHGAGAVVLHSAPIFFAMVYVVQCILLYCYDNSGQL